MKFKVYPKEGEPFELQLPRFEFSEDGFKVYDTNNAATNFAFLSLENVAAIIPEIKETAKDNILFHVYLKRREEPLEVLAHVFKSDEPPSARFYWTFTRQHQAIRNIYVALSEVVAIIPANPSAVSW